MKEMLNRLGGPKEEEAAPKEGTGDRDLILMRRRLDDLKSKTQLKQ